MWEVPLDRGCGTADSQKQISSGAADSQNQISSGTAGLQTGGRSYWVSSCLAIGYVASLTH
jgi:hypothetical protein